MSRWTLRAALAALAPAALAATSASAQPSSPAAAVAACADAASAGRTDEAARLAGDAEQTLRARIARAPRDAEALTLLARTLASCRLPFAEDVRKLELVGEAIDLTKQSLELRPDDWGTRFQLALLYYRMPSFLGKSDDAARQLDTLLLRQRDQGGPPVFARPYEYRGMLWSRAGRRDSAVAVWRRGARLFPADSALAARLREAGASDVGMPNGNAPNVGPSNGGAPHGSAAAAPAALGAVTVVAAASRPPRALLPVTTAPSQVALDRGRVLTTPGAMADVFQNVGLQPGATRMTEGSDVYTRGGSPAETPVYVDGGRMIASSRFEGLSGGLFGALDPAVLRSVRFTTGGFSARYGNALSGVLEVETEARPRERRARFGLSTAQGAATGRTPVRALGSRAGAFGTVRASNAAAMLAMHDRRGDFASAPWSVDAMGGVVAEPRPGTTLRAVALVEHDASSRVVTAGGVEAPFRAAGDTRLVVLSGSTIASRAPLQLRGSLSLGDRATAWQFGALARDARDGSAIARVEGDWMPREATTVRFGAEGGALSRRLSGRAPTTPRLDAGAPTLALGGADGEGLGGAFAEVETPVARSVTLLAGVRADRLPGETEPTLDPRLSLAWRTGAWTARVAGGLYHQGRWRTGGGAAVPNPGLPSAVATAATHLVAGIERDGAVHWRAEAFHKHYGRFAPLPALAGEAALLGPEATGGDADGVDVVAQRETGGRLTGWVGYSLLRARLDLADGRRVRSPNDVTHTLTAVSTLALARGLSFGTTARYGTGAPFTSVVGATTGASGTQPVYGAPLGERLPAYARLDARLMQHVPVRTGLLTAYVEAIDLLDRANVASYTYDASYAARRPVHGFFAARTFVVGVEYQPH